MIPYEELVYALQNWRARQGLAATVEPGPGSGPARTAPPAPPRPGSSSGSGAFAAPPLAPTLEDSLDVDDALVEEAHDASEGELANAFAGAFAGAPLDDGESTSIGGIPAPEDGTAVASESGRLRGPSGGNEDW